MITYVGLAAGSTYVTISSVSFDVTKSRPRGDGEATAPANSDTDVISVTIPRELRGRSEVLVFLSPQPVQG